MARINVDSGIPIPAPRKWGVFDAGVFAAMAVGDSFFMPATHSGRAVALPNGGWVRTGTLHSYAHHYGRKLGRKFSVRSVDGGYRCWRIE